MAPSNARGRRLRNEDSYSEDEGYQARIARSASPPVDSIEQQRIDAQNAIMFADLSTQTADHIKSVDKGAIRRVNVGALLGGRDVNKQGTEAHAAYLKNKASINLWNGKHSFPCSMILTHQYIDRTQIADNHEEALDPLDQGHGHRTGARVSEPNEYEAGYSTGSRGGHGGGRGGLSNRGGRGGGCANNTRP
jgi:hypothetical protein